MSSVPLPSSSEQGLPFPSFLSCSVSSFSAISFLEDEASFVSTGSWVFRVEVGMGLFSSFPFPVPHYRTQPGLQAVFPTDVLRPSF